METYTVKVKTGGNIKMGTNANVYITLIGKIGNSKEIHIGNPGKNFQRGSLDTFQLTDMNDLGNLSQVRIRHDNSGFEPGWYLEYVVVQKGELEWTFQCNRWLAKDEDDHLIDRTLNRSEDCDWKFELVDIDYHDEDIQQGRVPTTPILLREGYFTNDSSTAEIQEVFKAEQEFLSSFEYSFEETLTLEASEEVTLGVPDMASAKVTLKVAFSFQAGQKWSTTERETYSIEETIRIPPRTKIRVKGIVLWLKNVSIPFDLRSRVTANHKNSRIPLTNSELKEKLSKNGFTGTIIDETHVNELIVGIKGKLTGSWGIKNEVDVVDTISLQASSVKIIT